ncbi:MAG: Hsp20/alpha crystallin family protein [Cyanobacteria bacterium SZAS-4]|nr:Hsp20/alpha crystallin family protein [Cyanobacteria bacterium SZAS-4]
MFFQNLASPDSSLARVNLLQERLNRLINDKQETNSTEFPPVNIWASEKNIVITAEVPGIDPADIDLQICNQVLTLKTKRLANEQIDDHAVLRRERGHGEFARSIELPYAVDSENVGASVSKGMLTVELSRAAVDLPKKITVQAS